MRKNLLGRTGLEISEIALGAGVTAGILISGSEATRRQLLRRALAAGINWIDTAPTYGDGASEENIGQHLASLDPQPYVSTKVRIETSDMRDIPGAIERSVEGSLRRLNVQRIALLQLHNQLGAGVGGRPFLTTEQLLRRGGVADTFERLRVQRLIRATGITATGDSATCIEVINSGRFDTAQVYYNALNPSAGWSRVSSQWMAQDFSGIIGACWRQNMGILNIRVWAGGPLASSRPVDNLSVMTEGTDVDNELRCAAAIRRVLGHLYGTPAQAALRFVLGNKDLTSHIIGISQVEFLDEALAALNKGPLPLEAIAKLERLWATDFFSN